MIGTNLNFTVGTLTYTTATTQEQLNLALIIPVIVGPVVLVLLISLLLICIIMCVSARKSREKDKRLTTLLSQMELWEMEMADECKRGEQWGYKEATHFRSLVCVQVILVLQPLVAIAVATGFSVTIEST